MSALTKLSVTASSAARTGARAGRRPAPRRREGAGWAGSRSAGRGSASMRHIAPAPRAESGNDSMQVDLAVLPGRQIAMRLNPSGRFAPSKLQMMPAFREKPMLHYVARVIQGHGPPAATALTAVALLCGRAMLRCAISAWRGCGDPSLRPTRRCRSRPSHHRCESTPNPTPARTKTRARTPRAATKHSQTHIGIDTGDDFKRRWKMRLGSSG